MAVSHDKMADLLIKHGFMKDSVCKFDSQLVNVELYINF